MSTTRQRRSPLRSSRRTQDTSFQATEYRAEDIPTTRERFSGPSHDLIALLEEKALSIALRSDRYNGAEDIIHRVKFTCPTYHEIAARIHDGIIQVLLRKTDWKTFLTTLHADPDIGPLIFASFPSRTFTSAESDLHRSLKTYLAEL